MKTVVMVNRPPPGSRRIRYCSRRGCPRYLPWRANRAGTTGLRSEKKRVQNPLFWKVPNRDYRKGIEECLDLGGVGRETGVQGDHLPPVLGVLGHPHAHHNPGKEDIVQDLIFFEVIKYSLKCGQPACKRMAVWSLLLPSGTLGPSSTWLVPLWLYCGPSQSCNRFSFTLPEPQDN